MQEANFKTDILTSRRSESQLHLLGLGAIYGQLADNNVNKKNNKSSRSKKTGSSVTHMACTESDSVHSFEEETKPTEKASEQTETRKELAPWQVVVIYKGEGGLKNQDPSFSWEITLSCEIQQKVS